MARDERFISLAINVAGLSQHSRFKLGAVIVKGASVLSVGVNKHKTHPRQTNPHTKQKGQSIHAELSAILGLSAKKLRGSTIYIARVLSRGNVEIAKPCVVCRTLIEEVGIKRIVWTTAESYEVEKV